MKGNLKRLPFMCWTPVGGEEPGREAVVAAAVARSLFSGTGHTGTVPAPEPLREPPFPKACGVRPVRDLGAADGLPGLPSRAPGSPIRTWLWTCGRSSTRKFTPCFPPAEASHAPCPPLGGPAWKLTAPEGTEVWGGNARLQP